MLSELTRKNTAGQLKGLEPGSSILIIVAFVENQLETFAKEYSRTLVTKERGLTQKLCLLLNRQARLDGCPFWFEKEYMEVPEKGKSPTVDIGVIAQSSEGIFIHSKWYSNEESFFSMEAKRLDVISGAREKEYLIGRWENEKYRDCGGVERFKKGIHGRGLQYCALTGYVQKYDFDYWHRNINSWIDELIAGDNPSNTGWSNDDKLVMIRKTLTAAKFLSKNSREGGTINLFHLWINLTK